MTLSIQPPIAPDAVMIRLKRGWFSIRLLRLGVRGGRGGRCRLHSLSGLLSFGLNGVDQTTNLVVRTGVQILQDRVDHVDRKCQFFHF